MVSLLKRIQSRASAGLCRVGARRGMGICPNRVTTWPQWRVPAWSLKRSTRLRARHLVPVNAGRGGFRGLKEASVIDARRGRLSNLPSDELGMLAESGGHRAIERCVCEKSQYTSPFRQVARRVPSRRVVAPESSIGRIPGCFRASQRGGAAAGVAENATLVPDLPRRSMARLSQPNRYLPSSRARTQAPVSEFAHADDVHAGGEHQFGVAFPAGLRFLGGACVRDRPNAPDNNLRQNT